MSNTTSQQAIKLHEDNSGKLEVISKIPVNNSQDLSLAYTPGVGAVSRVVAQDPEKAKTLTLSGRTVAIISDGSAVLGLGNIGPQAAMPVMEGKALLIKEFAGLDSFPLVIDTQDSQEIINFVKQVSPTFCAVNLEDISAPRCFEIEEELQDIGIPVFHDDQHGTAIVVSAALRNAAKVVDKKYSDLRVGIIGAGAAGLAISKMLSGVNCRGNSCEVVPELSRVNDVIVFDRKGSLYSGRDGMNTYKEAVAGISNRDKLSGKPEEVLNGFDVVIGVSGPGSITKEMVSIMDEKAIVFALANPDPEIMPEDAKSAGAYVIATGRSDFPNQINNVLAFPAIFKIAHELELKRINMEVKIALSQALSELIPNPTQDEVIPSPFYPGLVEELVKRVKQKLS
jgi:malate dehydrogenase (oxaloacetate-decarboxylating)